MWDGPIVQVVAVIKVGTSKQLEDPLLQEAKARTKDNPIRELCGVVL